MEIVSGTVQYYCLFIFYLYSSIKFYWPRLMSNSHKYVYIIQIYTYTHVHNIYLFHSLNQGYYLMELTSSLCI